MGGNPESNPTRASNGPGISTREFIESLLTERDRRYDERFLAQDRFVLSKLEGIQRSTDKLADQYAVDKATSNEWRGALNDVTGRLPTRIEIDTKFNSMGEAMGILAKELQILREGRVADVGKSVGSQESRAEVKYAIGLFLALGGALAGYLFR